MQQQRNDSMTNCSCHVARKSTCVLRTQTMTSLAWWMLVLV